MEIHVIKNQLGLRNYMSNSSVTVKAANALLGWGSQNQLYNRLLETNIIIEP